MSQGTCSNALFITQQFCLTVDTTKSQAQKAIRRNNFHCCATCLEQFPTKKELAVHLKKKKTHRVNPNEVKQQYHQMREWRHQPEMAPHYLSAFVAVLLLEHLLR